MQRKKLEKKGYKIPEGCINLNISDDVCGPGYFCSIYKVILFIHSIKSSLVIFGFETFSFNHSVLFPLYILEK